MSRSCRSCWTAQQESRAESMGRAGGEGEDRDGDDYGAFIQRFQLCHPPPRCSSDPPLPLQGLTFAIKDM